MESIQGIPFLDLKSQQKELEGEIIRAISSTIDSAHYVLGPQVEEFESAFAAYCGCGHAVGVDSGTSALHLALVALGIGQGDEAITVPNSFVATIEAILYTGARPVLVDVDDSSYCIDVEAVEKALTPKTKAVVPVHLFGQPCDLDPLLTLAKERRFYVVEDACQAHGATYKGRRVGSIGDAAAFSFYPSKNLGGMGDGGAVTTSSSEIAEKVKMLRHHAQSEKNKHIAVGYSHRLDSIQAAVLKVKLKRLDGWNEKRRKNAAYYMDNLADSEFRFQDTVDGGVPVYHIFTVRHEKQSMIQESLDKAGIGWGKHIAPPVHLQPGYAFLGYGEGDFPISESLSRDLVSLPVYPELTRSQLDYIIETLRKVVVAI